MSLRSPQGLRISTSQFNLQANLGEGYVIGSPARLGTSLSTPLMQGQHGNGVGVDEEQRAVISSVSGDNDDQQRSKTTVLQTYIHLVKGYVGPGCLSLPWSFSQLGVIRGIVACLVLALWSSYNCSVIVRLKKRLNHANVQSPHTNATLHTYPDVGCWAYGKGFERYVLISICVQQLAICCVFFSFIGDNVACWVYHNNEVTERARVIIMTFFLPAILGLSCLRNLRQLAPATAAGTATLFIGFGFLATVMLQYRRPLDSQGGLESMASSSLLRIPLAMSSVLYSFEGINLILPIETAMQQPRHFFKVFWFSMSTVAVIFCTVAASCVLVFGRVTNGSITAFLLTLHDLQGDQRDLVLLANLFVSVSVVLTYPLQLFPCLELIAQLVMDCRKPRDGHVMLSQSYEENVAVGVQDDDDNDDAVSLDKTPDDDDLPEVDEIEGMSNRNRNTADYVADDDNDDEVSINPTSIPGDSAQLRLVLVLLTYFVAILVPNVSALISLAGALAGSSTALLIPPLVEMESIRRTSKNIIGRARCWVLFLLGLIFCLVGTGAAIDDIVQIYQKR